MSPDVSSNLVTYKSPGDMTVIAWHAWFVVTDPETDEDQIVRFNSRDHTWEEIPDDGCLGLRLIHAAEKGGVHRAVTLHYSWYFRADSNLGTIWGGTDREEDLRPGRYRNPVIKHGKWIAWEAYGPLLEEMSRRFGLD